MPDLPIVTPGQDNVPAPQATKKPTQDISAYVKFVRNGSNWYGVKADGTRTLLDPATLKPRL